MSLLRSLRIRLGEREVGSLFVLDDGRSYFRFDDAYSADLQRRSLSISFLGANPAQTTTQLSNPHLAATIGRGNGKLPVFFRNLLPEGMLRQHLLSLAGLAPDDELGLLAFCGHDLPGDVWAVAENLSQPALARLITQGRDSYEMSSLQLPTPQAISLSGVQPKLSLAEHGGHYVMRGKDQTGKHFIGKLPTSDYANLPEVEYTSLQLAKAAGVNVCHAELRPLAAISGAIPFSMRSDAQQFLLVERFDRIVQGQQSQRLHMEDFAQALELAPEEKYHGSYAAIGLVLQMASSAPQDDVLELLRRIKVNEMLGNFDAHVKNFSLLYSAAQTVRLSPAYDIVAYAVYLAGSGHALKFYPQQQTRSLLTPAVLRQLANVWQLPETKLREVLTDTVALAVQRWPHIIAESVLMPSQQQHLLQHFWQNPAVKSYARRNA